MLQNKLTKSIKWIFIVLLSAGFLGSIISIAYYKAKNISATIGKDESHFILASNSAIASIIRAIGGEKVKVRPLSSKIDASSHDLIINPSMLSYLLRSKAVFFSSSHVEPVIRQLSNRGKTKTVKFIEITTSPIFRAAIHQEYFKKDNNAQNQSNNIPTRLDPHFWISPISAKIGGKAILNELISLFPEYKDHFNKNYNNFEKALENLFTKTYPSMSRCQNQFYSMHNGYFYLYKTYHLNYIGNLSHDIESGISPQKMLNAKLTIAHNTTCLLCEAGMNLDNILKDIKEKIPYLTIVKVDTDGLTIPASAGLQDYLSYLEKNLKNISDCICANKQ